MLALGCYIYQRQVYKQCRNLINTNWNNTQTHDFNKGATVIDDEYVTAKLECQPKQ